MDLKDLVGEHMLTGVDSGILRVGTSGFFDDVTRILSVLDGITYQAIEDPNDGYRSSMREISIVTDGTIVANTFPPHRVMCRYHENHENLYGSCDACDLLELIDVTTGQIVLLVGTNHTDDYYPSFVGDFQPQHLAINQGAK